MLVTIIQKDLTMDYYEGGTFLQKCIMGIKKSFLSLFNSRVVKTRESSYHLEIDKDDHIKPMKCVWDMHTALTIQDDDFPSF